MIIGVLLSALFLYLAFRKADAGALAAGLRTADLADIFLAVVPLYLGYAVRTLLWQKIISVSKKVDFFSAFSSLIIGFFANNVLPGRAGEFIRAYILGAREDMRTTFVLGTITVERLFDVITLLLFLIFPAFLFSMPDWAEHIAVTTCMVLLIVLATVYLAVFKQGSFLDKLRRALFFLSDSKSRFVVSKLDSFTSGLGVLKNPGLVLTIFVLSLLTWLLMALYMFFTLQSMDIDIPGYGVFFALSIINLGVIIPSSPGYIGTYQFLCVIALSAFSVDKEAALGFSIISHALWYLPLTALGMIFLWKENISLAKLRMIKKEAAH